MPTAVKTISTSTPTTPPSRRRTLFAAAGAAIIGSGITAGAAASVADLVPELTDADLIALRPRLDIAVRNAGYTETHHPPGLSNDEYEAWVHETAVELEDVCWAIVEAPAAQTAAGRALKAAAAMHHLKASYHGGGGGWPGAGESQAWDVLSEIAGDAYVPVLVPEWLHGLEPGRV